MDHYHKAETRKYATPPEPHEIRISQRHRIKEVVSKALRYLAVSCNLHLCLDQLSLMKSAPVTG